MISDAARLAMQGGPEDVKESVSPDESVEKHLSPSGKKVLESLPAEMSRDGVKIEFAELQLKGTGVVFVTYKNRATNEPQEDLTRHSVETVEFVGGDGVITRSDVDGFKVDLQELHNTIQDAQNLVEFHIDSLTVIVVKKTKDVVDAHGEVVTFDTVYIVRAVNIDEAKSAVAGG